MAEPFIALTSTTNLPVWVNVAQIHFIRRNSNGITEIHFSDADTRSLNVKEPAETVVQQATRALGNGVYPSPTNP